MINTRQVIDSIIFDMDGTLWDAVSTYAKAWNDYFNSEGQDRQIDTPQLRALMGVEEKIVLGQILPHMEEAQRGRIYREKVIPLIYQRVELEGGHLYGGVVPGLKKLSGRYPLFIVSNCPEKLIHYFMQWAGIEPCITGTMAHGQNYRSKAENMLLIKEKYNLRNPVYVGDTEADSSQSSKACIPFFFMDYGFGTCQHYQMKFSCFDDFTEFMIHQ